MEWIRSTCPDAEQLDLYYVAEVHANDCTVGVNQQSPRAVTDDGYTAVEAYHAAKVLIEWTGAETKLLMHTYDGPDIAGIMKAHEQQGRINELGKCNTKFHPTSTKALLRGPGFQNLLRQHNKHVLNYLTSGAFKRVLLENNRGPLIVMHGGIIPRAMRGFTPTIVTRVGVHVGRDHGKLRRRRPAGAGLWRLRHSAWVP